MPEEPMPDTRRGAGVLFYDKEKRRVLLYRRDKKPTIPFPDQLDILGGHTESGETPEQTAVREMAEELDDLRTGAPFVLTGHKFFMTFTDARGITDSIFYTAADFDLAEVRLKEGQELVWLTEDEAKRIPLAFGYNPIVAAFFQALRAGTI
jgi:8-oxo-dGTP pyrophosphatase MutT (NUDIX family)